MKTYSVELKRDTDGWWVASVRGVPGCRTQGRTIRQTMRRAREALSLFVDDAGRAKLKAVFPATIVHLVEALRGAQERAKREEARARKARERAVAILTARGLSVRDAGELLGLSHQRVQQLREAAEVRT